MEKRFTERLQNLPVPILPTTVGMLTLSNVYGGMGFSLVRHISMFVGTLIILFYTLKIIMYKDTVIEEYKQTVPASLYGGFTMSIMILGSYYIDYNYALGKGLWSFAVGLHFIHILVFTYRNVIKKRDIITFVPSWFVTYNGFLVSSVVGGAMNEPVLTKYIALYGVVIYFIILVFMLYRLTTQPIPKALYHTQAILIAPCSLTIVSYLNTVADPNRLLVYILYFAVFASLSFIIIKLPRFFALEFTPAYAGLTFPMAIGTVATGKFIEYLKGINELNLVPFLEQLRGIQIYLTTFIIGYVLVNFLVMFLKTDKKMKEIYND